MYKKLVWYNAGGQKWKRSGAAAPMQKKPPPPSLGAVACLELSAVEVPFCVLQESLEVALHRSLLDHKNLSGITKLQHNLLLFLNLG